MRREVGNKRMNLAAGVVLIKHDDFF